MRKRRNKKKKKENFFTRELYCELLKKKMF